MDDEGSIHNEWNEAESNIIVENNRLLYGTLAVAQKQLLELEESHGDEPEDEYSEENSDNVDLEDENIKGSEEEEFED